MTRTRLGPILLLLLVAAAPAPPGEVTLTAGTRRQVDAFEKKYDVVVEPVDQPRTGNIAYDALTRGDQLHYEHVTQVLVKEFGLYPPAFVRATGLKKLVLARHVRVGKQERADVVLPKGGVLVIDVDTSEVRNYLRHSIHHEYFHLIELTTAGDFYFKDPKWAALNVSGTVYGKGGVYDQDSATDPAQLVHPKPGFVDHYATSGLEEDMAEVFGCLMVPEEARVIQMWTANDRVLANKIKYIRDFSAWWSKEDVGAIRELMDAITHDHTNAAVALLEANPELAKEAAWNGWRPLQWAAAHGSAGIVAMLAKRVGVDDADEQGWTALHVAAVMGHEGTVRQLLALGADRARRDKLQKTPGDYAKEMKHADVAKLLQ